MGFRAKRSQIVAVIGKKFPSKVDQDDQRTY